MSSQGKIALLILSMAFSFGLQSSMAADDIVTENRWADFVKAIGPYASAAYAYDSNLFRLPDELIPPITPPDGRSDQYSTISGGIDSTLKLSQQEILLRGHVYRNSYSTYDDLDYTGGNALAQWNWSAGKRLNGELGYKYDRRLRSFENQLIRSKDLKTEEKILAGVDLKFARNWLINLRASTADISFDSTALLDLEREVVGAAINYTSSAGNELGFDTELTEGTYDLNLLRNFDELNIGPTFDWTLTEKTKIRGKIGYTRREHDDVNRVDYDDITGDITLVRKGGAGNKLTAKLYRKLSNLSDEIASFAVVQGISVAPKWQLTSKIELSLLLGYEYRDFQGQGFLPSPPDLESRDDKVYTGNLLVDWELTRIFTLSFGLDTQKRTSNRDLEDYEYRNIHAELIAEF
jgi:exopolysaccharide biosynthesis operon protein EpsL